MNIKLIPTEDISTLKPASEVKAVADAAIRIQQEAAVARLINYAANTGEHTVVWQHPMDDALRDVLQGQGYKITRRPFSASTNDQTSEWIISGF